LPVVASLALHFLAARNFQPDSAGPWEFSSSN
jgi:hypothetical protein